MKNVTSITKIIIAAAIAAALFVGCGKNEGAAQQPISDASVNEATDVSLDESTAAKTEADESATSEISSEKADENSEVPLKFDNSAFDDLFNENKTEYIIVLDINGDYKKLTEEECYSVYMGEYISQMLTEEYYNEFIKDDEYYDVTDFEDYKQQIMESFGISEADLTSQEEYSCVFNISGNSDNENADYDKAAKAAFEYVMNSIGSGDVPLFQEEQAQKNVVIYYYIEGDFMNIDAYGYSDTEQYNIAADEYISLSGKDVMIIGSTPVSTDTKSLFISAYDETRAAILNDFDIDEYDVVIYDYVSGNSEENAVLNTAELAEKLPGLERLCISAYIDISDMSAFSKLNDLNELRIDVSGMDDISELSGIKTNKLVINSIGCPVDALSELDVNELCIECTPFDDVLESVYKLENVSELTIEKYSDTEPCLDGIENLSSLKKLDISVGAGNVIDLAPIAKLRNVEDLTICAYKTKNLDKISGMKSVRKLMLHSMDKEDLSFLSAMKDLETLTLMYVNNSFGPSLQYLKNVKHLYISDITGGADMSRIFQMDNLEELTIMGERFLDCGIDNLQKLKVLRLMLCSYSDLSGLKKCGALENLIIYNCLTPEFNAKDIEGMTQLKYLDFNCSEIKNYESFKTLTGLEDLKLYFCDLSADELKELKKALPDCVITLDSGNTVS